MHYQWWGKWRTRQNSFCAFLVRTMQLGNIPVCHGRLSTRTHRNHKLFHHDAFTLTDGLGNDQKEKWYPFC